LTAEIFIRGTATTLAPVALEFLGAVPAARSPFFAAAALAASRPLALLVVAAAAMLIAAALPAVIVTIVVRHCLPLLCVLTNDVR